MSLSYQSCQYAVIGAGPYGLATAAHLRGAGLDVRVLGKTMDFWHNHMPKGMLLRSPRHGSDIGDPQQALTLDRYEATRSGKLSQRVPLEDFVSYGRWFQRQALPDLDQRMVTGILRDGDEYRLTLDDGDALTAQNVVVAAGIGAFANRPAVFAPLPSELVSHTSARANRDLSRFAGKRVVVVGAGQSAIESAALLHENGAQVEVLVREPQLRWLGSRPALEWLSARLNPLKAPGKIGPIGLDWLIEHPRLFTSMPRSLQERWAYRAIRPAASGWLRPRTEQVTVSTGRQVTAATERGDKVHLQLSDGSSREADHVLLGTGYKISIERYGLLSHDLMESVRTVNGYPVLNAGFESSAPGLYFVGASAARSFGPLCRFVVGTQFTARTLARFAQETRAAASDRPRRLREMSMMETKRIYLSPPHLGGEEAAFVQDAIASNWIAPLGPHVDAFEKEFARMVGVAHAAALSSGTAALHLALRLVGVQPGDTVLCPSLTFCATANPIVYDGGVPVFIDADPTTWNMDSNLLHDELRERAAEGRLPKAVMCVDLYGQCADYDTILEICDRYQVPVIEDAAEALGSTYRGRNAGVFGKCAAFSFNGNKIITTSGGGMLVGEDGEFIERARFLAAQARDPAPHYEHSVVGFNYRMSNVLAALGRGQLRVLRDRVAARRRIHDYYRSALADLPGIGFMPQANYGRPNGWLTCITIDPRRFGATRHEVQRALEVANIEARAVWKPLHLQPVFASCRSRGGQVAEKLFEQGMCLPSGSAMSDADLDRVIAVIRAARRS